MSKYKSMKHRNFLILLTCFYLVAGICLSACQKGEPETGISAVTAATESMKFASDDAIVESETYFAAKPLDFMSYLEEGESATVTNTVVTDSKVFLNLFSINEKMTDEVYRKAYEISGGWELSKEAQEMTDEVWKEAQRTVIFVLDFEGNLINQIDPMEILPEDIDSVGWLLPGPDNELLLLANESYDENREYNDEYIFRMDEKGNLIGDRILIPAEKEEGIEKNYDGYALSVDGTLYMKGQGYSDEKSYVLLDAYDANGNHVLSITEEIDYKTDRRYEKIFMSGETAYLMEADGNTGARTLYQIDLDNEELLPQTEFSFHLSEPDVREEKLFYSDVDGVKSIDMDGQNAEAFLQWKDIDVGLGSWRTPTILSPDRVLLHCPQDSMLSSYESEWFLLSRTSENPHMGKDIIRVGGHDVTLHPDILYAVREFNETTKDKRVELVDFSSWGYGEENTDQIKMLLLSGEIPDVLVNTYRELDFPVMAAKGLLADMTPLMKTDDNFSKNDYTDLMFTLPLQNNQLFYTFTNYTLEGIFVKKEQLPDSTGWTIEEMNLQIDKFTDPRQSFSQMSQLDLLSTLIRVSYPELVDFPNKTVSFDSEAFAEILQFSMERGNQIDEQNYDETSQEMNWAAGGMITTPLYWRFTWNESGEDITMAGFPANNDNHILCNPVKLIAVSNYGKKENAWEFVKILLSQDAQEKISESLPVHQEQLRALLDEQRKPPEEAGKEHLQMYKNLTDEAIEEVFTIQKKADVLSLTNTEIMDIVYTEAQAYFAGQKTLEMTMEIIQNRAQTVVNQI